VEIYPVPECLDGRDDPGRKRAPGHNLPLGVTRRTETPRLAGKRQEVFRPAVRAADPGDRFGLSSWKNIQRSMRANPHFGLSHVFEQVTLTRPPREGLRNAALMEAEESGEYF